MIITEHPPNAVAVGQTGNIGNTGRQGDPIPRRREGRRGRPGRPGGPGNPGNTGPAGPGVSSVSSSTSASDSTGSASYVDTGASVSISLSQTGIVVILATGKATYNSGIGDVGSIIEVDVDGTGYNEVAAITTAALYQTKPWCIALALSLASGSHTIKVRHKNGSSTSELLNTVLRVTY